jgi:hypothetical protein
MEPKYLLIVKVPQGIIIRDTPRPQSQGGIERRRAGVGTTLQAYRIINVNGVDYAWLVPQNPLKAEWARVAEADGSIEYVEVLDLEPENDGLAGAIRELARAIEKLAERNK